MGVAVGVVPEEVDRIAFGPAHGPNPDFDGVTVKHHFQIEGGFVGGLERRRRSNPLGGDHAFGRPAVGVIRFNVHDVHRGVPGDLPFRVAVKHLDGSEAARPDFSALGGNMVDALVGDAVQFGPLGGDPPRHQKEAVHDRPVGQGRVPSDRGGQFAHEALFLLGG